MKDMARVAPLKNPQNFEDLPDYEDDEKHHNRADIHNQSKQAQLLVSAFKSNLHPKSPGFRKIQRRGLER